MRKFECKDCYKKCQTMVIIEPKFCLLFGDKADWHEVKEVDSAENAQTTNEQFGNSEQLPDWVKVGNLVYCSKTGNYGEIKTIKDNKIYLRLINTDEVLPVKLNMVLKNGRPARKRPFNDDEMKALVGKVVEHGNNRYLVTSYLEGGEGIIYLRICESWETEKSIMNNYTINGKPCYKLEHLENGEWVE